jgi:ribosomal protein S3
VKVWIFKGEVFEKPSVDQPVATGESGEGAQAPAAPAAEATA